MALQKQLQQRAEEKEDNTKKWRCSLPIPEGRVQGDTGQQKRRSQVRKVMEKGWRRGQGATAIFLPFPKGIRKDTSGQKGGRRRR